MNTNHMGIALAAFLILSTGTLAQAYAAYWHVGGSGTISNIVEVRGDVTVPPGPDTDAIGATTLFWLGADLDGGTDYLAQPVLLAVSSVNGDWRGIFEIVSYTNPPVDTDYEFTNMYFDDGDEVFMDIVVFPSGIHQNEVWMQIDDKNTIYEANMFLDGATYPTTMSKAWGILESYDFTESDFAPMNDDIEFTNIKKYTTLGGSSSSVSMSTFEWASSGSPPDCISSSAGSGWTTITVDC